eukprot:4619198-Prymnesium_polylepis.1
MEKRELHRTMGLRLAADGLCELQPRKTCAPDAFRGKASGGGHVGLDHAIPRKRGQFSNWKSSPP